MSTKLLRTFIIIIQVVMTAFLLFADFCGILSAKDFLAAKPMVESFVRCVLVLSFTIFYYVSVSDSFSSETIFFPLYLLFLSVSETRILEIVQPTLSIFPISQQHLVFILIFSSFMLCFSVIGYCLMPNGSRRNTNLFAGTALVASFVISQSFPKAQNISGTWQSTKLISLLIFFFLVGIVSALIQTIRESSVSLKVKYTICVLLLINNYINLVYNTTSMNLIGTILFALSIGLTVILVKINSTKL